VKKAVRKSKKSYDPTTVSTRDKDDAMDSSAVPAEMQREGQRSHASGDHHPPTLFLPKSGPQATALLASSPVHRRTRTGGAAKPFPIGSMTLLSKRTRAGARVAGQEVAAVGAEMIVVGTETTAGATKEVFFGAEMISVDTETTPVPTGMTAVRTWIVPARVITALATKEGGLTDTSAGRGAALPTNRRVRRSAAQPQARVLPNASYESSAHATKVAPAPQITLLTRFAAMLSTYPCCLGVSPL